MYDFIGFNRNKIIRQLLKKNISLSITYPYPVHIMKPYRSFFKKKYEKLSKTESFANQIFSLPTYPSIKDNYVEKIISEVNKFI